jgi:hydroxymethylglutaryl-CoA lyase
MSRMSAISPTDLKRCVAGTRVDLREVGLREGLQAQPNVVPTESKVRWAKKLINAGYSEINAVSFVRPDVMPQMADAEALLERLADALSLTTRVSGLAPNQRGVDRAIAARRHEQLHDVILVTAATASTLQANGMSADPEQRMSEIERWAALCKEAGLRVIVFISAALGCSIEGRVEPGVVLRLAERLGGIASVDEIVISDSTGQADPLQVHNLLARLADVAPIDQRLGLHFHDSRGAGLANIAVAMLSPFQWFAVDTAFGGWGGDVPFIPEASGNVSSEDVAEMLKGMGCDLRVDVERVIEVTKEVSLALNILPRSRVADTGVVRWKNDPSHRMRGGDSDYRR